MEYSIKLNKPIKTSEELPDKTHLKVVEIRLRWLHDEEPRIVETKGVFGYLKNDKFVAFPGDLIRTNILVGDPVKSILSAAGNDMIEATVGELLDIKDFETQECVYVGIQETKGE